MHFSVTDLPVPEPPMIATDSACSTDRLTPSSTVLSPKRFTTSVSLILGCHAVAISRAPRW